MEQTQTTTPEPTEKSGSGFLGGAAAIGAGAGAVWKVDQLVANKGIKEALKSTDEKAGETAEKSAAKKFKSATSEIVAKNDSLQEAQKVLGAVEGHLKNPTDVTQVVFEKAADGAKGFNVVVSNANAEAVIPSALDKLPGGVTIAADAQRVRVTGEQAQALFAGDKAPMKAVAEKLEKSFVADIRKAGGKGFGLKNSGISGGLKAAAWAVPTAIVTKVVLDKTLGKSRVAEAPSVEAAR